MNYTLIFVWISTFFILIGCSSSGSDDFYPPRDSQPLTLDQEVSLEIIGRNLTGDASIGRNFPDISEPLPQLGMKLFFTKALGGNSDSACVSCHHPKLGGGDDLALSIGVDAIEPDVLGPGRVHTSGELTVPRNAPTTFNIALWRRVLFLDGRVENLMGGDIRTPDSTFGTADPFAGTNLTSAQARFPITSPDEMRGFTFEAGNDNDAVRDHLAARLGDYGIGTGELAVNTWLSEFQFAFNSTADAATLITYTNIAEAIAAYENSQVFVSTPWRAYVQGDVDAISEAAKRGALLFYRSIEAGGANCVSCHSGDFFTDERFHVLALPQIGSGKGDGATGNNDFGRFRETGNDQDLFAFRTPTLLNVEVTEPFGHDGAYDTLEGIIRHHLNPVEAITNYNFALLDPSIPVVNAVVNTNEALAKLEDNRAQGIPSIQDVVLTDEQVNDLVEFLKTLTDPCVKDDVCLEQWIPGASDSNPDGLRLEATGLSANN